MFPKPVGQFVNGHPVAQEFKAHFHARLSLIGTNPPVGANQVPGVAYLLHRRKSLKRIQIACQGSSLIECRRRLLPSMLGDKGSARSAAAVVLIAFLLLCVHRTLSLCSLN